MIYLQLFFAFMQIGAFSFGGGYAAMPLIESQVIDRYGWLTRADFADLVTIAEMTPGPIAINAATFVGNLTAGIPGALCATTGLILPPCIFATVLAYLYKKYKDLSLMQGILQSLRPTVVALILTAGLRILLPAVFADGTVSPAAGNVNVRTVVYFLAALLCLRKWKISPIKVMVGCGVAEVIVSLVLG